MRFDVPRGHTTRIERDNLVIEKRDPFLILRNDDRFNSFAVSVLTSPFCPRTSSCANPWKSICRAVDRLRLSLSVFFWPYQTLLAGWHAMAIYTNFVTGPFLIVEILCRKFKYTFSAWIYLVFIGKCYRKQGNKSHINITVSCQTIQNLSRHFTGSFHS